MGRKKKYNTLEEQRQANRDKFMRYYWRNAKKIKKQNLERYYENKRNISNIK